MASVGTANSIKLTGSSVSTATKAINPTNSKTTAGTNEAADTDDKAEEDKDTGTTNNTNNTAQKTTTEELTPYQQGFKAAESVYQPQLEACEQQVTTLEQQNDQLQTQVNSQNQQQQNIGAWYALSALSSLGPLLGGLAYAKGANQGEDCEDKEDPKSSKGTTPQNEHSQINAEAYDDNGFPINSPGQTAEQAKTTNTEPTIDAIPKLPPAEAPMPEAIPDIGES
jgi:hypothetical protein